jgi:hypothetical protein
MPRNCIFARKKNNMRFFSFLAMAILCVLTACTGGSDSPAAQKALNQWFPDQYKIVGKKGADWYNSLLEVEAQNDPKLRFTLDWANKEANGELQKADVEKAIEAAKVNRPLAESIVATLKKNALDAVSVGVDRKENRVEIVIYEDPYSQIFSAQLVQISKLVQDWARSNNWFSCFFTLRVIEASERGKYYSEVFDGRLLGGRNDWATNKSLVTAQANVLDENSMLLLPSTVSLGLEREKAFRQKAHAQVVDFLSAQFPDALHHVELQSMVTSSLELKNMNEIRYSFPYCPLSEDTKANGSCRGSFAGRVSAYYNLKSNTVDNIGMESGIVPGF